MQGVGGVEGVGGVGWRTKLLETAVAFDPAVSHSPDAPGYIYSTN